MLGNFGNNTATILFTQNLFYYICWIGWLFLFPFYSCLRSWLPAQRLGFQAKAASAFGTALEGQSPSGPRVARICYPLDGLRPICNAWKPVKATFF